MSIHLFLSPHYDDAVGSCSGAIQRLRASGQTVHVLTLFGGTQTPLSAFARQLHDDWGLEDPMPHRRGENAEACALLDCQSDSLDFADAIYRRGTAGEALYDSFEALKAEPAEDDHDLGERIAGAICGRYTKQDCTVYCPLSIGNHVDHVVTRRAGEVLRARGWQVIFYTDFFYDSFSEPTRFAGTDQTYASLTLHLTRDEIRAAEAAIAAYASQIQPLFGDAGGLKRYCLKHGRKETYYLASETDADAFRRALPAPGGVYAERMSYLSCLLERAVNRISA